jgi:glycine/D-amino acid oxidase-like deaminating enzyme
VRAALRSVNGEVSFWYAPAGPPEPRTPLRGDRDVDVAVVGAGFTGLWTAYYLARERPELRIAVLEREFAGFGASGRNGGWLSAELGGTQRRLAGHAGDDGVRRVHAALVAGIGEVTAVASAEGIDAGVAPGGVLRVATGTAQLDRLRAAVAADRRWGDGTTRLLDAGELAERIRVRGAVAGAHSPHGARVQPAALVRGLADAVRRRGVTIHEGTPVTSILPGPPTARVLTPHGTVRARWVLRGTEGFAGGSPGGLPGHRRELLPMNSVMVATDPLPEQVWARIGWSGGELFGDLAHLFCYAQRTEDGRIALGGRGIPYRFGSRIDARGRTPWRNLASLWAVLGRYFPDAVAAAGPAHVWCGVLGVPRDWCPTVHLDRRTGLGHAGGYAGHGLTMANVAARALADLVLERRTELTGLPIVTDRVRRWEPEPLRWLGVRTVYGLYRAADRHERGRARTSPLARAAGLISGQ